MRQLHSKYTKGCLINRRVERGRDTEGEHPAHVDWINDAIIPQPRGCIVGMTLGLILLADGSFELFLLVLGPFLALRLQAVTPDRGEDGSSLFTAHHRD